MKNKILIGCLALASALSFSSCSDFLTEEPEGKLAPETFFASQNDLDMSVYAMYSLIQGYQCNSNPMILDCQGSDVTSTTGSNKAAYLSADAFEEPIDMKGLNDRWNNLYKIIKSANLIIINADRTPTSQEEINIAKGNAYYWRAFAYFNLVRMWGPVILNLTNENDNNEGVPASVAEVYDQIIKDLEAALACNLPAKYSAAPRAIDGANNYVSDQAVRATLAAVYLHKAGYPLNDASAYNQAAKYAWDVISGVKSGKYDQAVVAWDQVYNYGNNHNNGCILGIDYRSRAGGWSSYDSQLTSCHQSGKLWSGWGDFLAERYFWSKYPEGPRKDNVYAKQICLNDGNVVDWWATTDGKPYDGSNNAVPDFRPMFIGFSVNNGPNGPVAAPFDYTQPTWGGMCLDKRHQLIRYSEVLCWYAEAVGRGGQGNLADAQNALKEVRTAAYAAGDPAIAECGTLSGEALAKAAAQEHKWEVAGNVLSMVTVRSDEFRLNEMETVFNNMKNSDSFVLVPAGTLTTSEDADGKIFTYTTTADVKVKENNPVNGSWSASRIYQLYPPTETAKNPNLVR